MLVKELLSSKILKYLRTLNSELTISDHLRGWSWYKEPVRPCTDIVKLSLSDIVNRYCSTMRDIYLKYVVGVEVELTPSMIWGRVIHEVFKQTIENVKKIYLNTSDVITGYELVQLLNDDIEKNVNSIINSIKNSVNDEKFIDKLTKASINLSKFLILQIASHIDLEIAKNNKYFNKIDLISHVIPFFLEYKVDGTLIGLKDNLRVDLLTYNIVIELKTGKVETFHKYALTGYALAIESDFEIPIDYGLLMYINFTLDKMIPKIKIQPIVISDELRKEFLEIRDNAIEIILHEKDPGKASNCPVECPYRTYCS